MQASTPHQTDFFPPKPENVPKKLAAPTLKYRFHAWLALGGLALFALAYLSLIAWFGYSSYRLFAESEGILDIIWAFCAAVLTVFLAKGMFFRKSSGGGGDGYEVTPEQQPRLFEFLHKVADEAGAPRPHKVFLSPAVNASVFYDLSLLNFIFPTRKNLNIGLALINVLTLSELKAVLAHEFGHFAQRSMAVGRWVYTAQQVATQLVYHRDALDNFLNIISGIDIRIAWIGWLLRLIVWSLRSILDSLLSLIMLAERALSREMEFQADLVAVSTTGSDALVHGLFRLPPADEAWDDAIEFINDQLKEGFKTEDVFAIQTRVLQHQQRILNDPDYASVPPMPNEARDKHRIFTQEIAQPPQMWSTHPQSHLREENAKKTYISAELDNRSAWLIFDDPEKLRHEYSAYLFDDLEQKRRPIADTVQALDKTYEKEAFQAKYRGVYLERSIVRDFETPGDLFYDLQQHSNLGTSADLYPASLTDDLEKLRNLQKEKGMLEAINDRRVELTDGIIRFRGNVIKRSGLVSAIDQSSEDIENCRAHLVEHDRHCRSYHMAIANVQQQPWNRFLRGLVDVLHYSDHTLRDLMDADRKLANTFHVVIADGNVSGNEMIRLVADAQDVYKALRDIYEKKFMLVLDPNILKRLDVGHWSELLEEKFDLPAPNNQIMQDWLEVIDGWVGLTGEALHKLRDATQEELLCTEASLLDAHINSLALEGAPPTPSSVPGAYRTLLPGKERSLQTRLNLWDSFQTATGFGPGLLRFAISFAIVAGAIFITLPAAWKQWVFQLFGNSG